jgi:translocation and assembly module TamA
MKCAWIGVLLTALCGGAWAQDGGAPSAFHLSIEAPDEIRTVLERHLELQRYRALTDLSDNELERLMTIAAQDSRDLVATLGYFSPVVRIDRPGDGNTKPRVITLTVEPGRPTLISEVTVAFSGPITQDPLAAAQRQQIQDSWSLRTGMRFSQNRWDTAKHQALRQLTTVRYPTGQIDSSTADVDALNYVAHLSLTLDSGPAYQLGGLLVGGLERYDTELVTRLARLPLGTPYAQSDLVAAQQRLTDSGFFDSAYVNLNTAGDPVAAPVLVELREAKLQKLVSGVGISTDAGARLSLEHTHNKVPGLGWRAVSKIALDRETRSIGTELTAPPDPDHWRWVTSAQWQAQRTGSVDVNSQRLRFGRSQSQDRADRSVYAQYDRANTANIDSTEPALVQALSAYYAVTLRNFDSTPFPSRGWGVGLAVGGGATLGSPTDPYARVLARGLTYLPLDRDTRGSASTQPAGRLALRAELGAVLAKEGIALPSTELFLTGGDNSVRGYTFRSIGVVRPGGLVVPGRYLATGSVEWQRPITMKGQLSDWESTVFIDAGAVADHVSELRPKVGVGAGVRWKSPVGPLQIDLAYGLEVKLLRLHMNVGFSF